MGPVRGVAISFAAPRLTRLRGLGHGRWDGWYAPGMRSLMGIRSLGTNRWVVCVVWKDPRTGKRREVKRRCTGPKRDAKALEARIRGELESDVIRERMTLGEYARSWLRRRVDSLKPSTAAKYGNDLALHILPALGDVYVDQLRPSDVQEWVNADAGAPNSVVNRVRLLRTIAKDAVADGVTDRDFCARVKPPEVEGYDEANPNLLTPAELDRLFEAIPAAWQALVVTDIYTGLRWGELSALHWEDIDEGAGVIRVRWTNWKGRLQVPKTKRARRAVPMVQPVAAALRAHRRRMVAAQHPGLGAGLVFPTRTGDLHRGTPLRKVLDQACAAAGVPRITPHGLRRSFNDIVRRHAEGAVVRALVGHSDERMTDHYSLVRMAEKRAAAESDVDAISAAKVETAVETKGVGTA